MRSFQLLFSELRHKLTGAQTANGVQELNRAFAEAKLRHECLAHYDSIASVLAVMKDESVTGWPERELLTRALVAEFQKRPTPFWTSALLVAYYPMLSRLRHRILGNILDERDLDQLVVTCFLQAARALRLSETPDWTAVRLRQRTARRVFMAIRYEQKEKHDSFSSSELVPILEQSVKANTLCELYDYQNSNDQSVPEESVALLLDLAAHHISEENLDLIISTFLKREKLRDYASRVNYNHEPEERVYQRLKRRRSRVIVRLRRLLDENKDEINVSPFHRYRALPGSGTEIREWERKVR
jgi:hypothetical protein